MSTTGATVANRHMHATWHCNFDANKETMMQHSCCKDCEPGKSRKTIENNEKVFDANKDTMVQYSCSAVCEPGKLGKIENHERRMVLK